MRNRARGLLVLAVLCQGVGLVLLIPHPSVSYAVMSAAIVVAVIGGHLHGAADERGRIERERTP